MAHFDRARLRSWGTTLLRVAVGAVFMAHGAQKLFVYGIAHTAAGFGHMGLPSPMVSATLASGAEFVGGLLLILGLLTRWAAAAIAFDMLVAVFMVHLPNGFFLPKGAEYALTMLAANLSLVLTGPGAFALDHLIWRGHPRPREYRPGLAA